MSYAAATAADISNFWSAIIAVSDLAAQEGGRDDLPALELLTLIIMYCDFYLLVLIWKSLLDEFVF